MKCRTLFLVLLTLKKSLSGGVGFGFGFGWGFAPRPAPILPARGSKSKYLKDNFGGRGEGKGGVIGAV